MASFPFSILPTTTTDTSQRRVEATAVLLALHSAPVYFHRKGKGRFRKAPPDILAAALAGLEKKRQQALAIERMVGELKEFRLPPEIGALTDALLYKPDRNKPETKAFETACAETGLSAAHLLFKCGAIKSPYYLPLPALPARALPARHRLSRHSKRPACRATCRAPTCAPSRSTMRQTTEIDDAFSVVKLPGIGSRVGIHIAAPGSGHRTRLAARRHRPRPAVHGLHAGQQDHHAARRRGRRTTRWPAASIARRCRST